MATLFIGPAWCAHGRTGDSCQDCRTEVMRARGGRIPVPVISDPVPDPVYAETDLHIERADLGPGAWTFVAKGDPIPKGLLNMPRNVIKPASAKPGRKRSAVS